MAYVVLFLLSIIISFIVGFFKGVKFSDREILKIRNMANKNMELFKVAVKWLKDSQKIINYINRKGYKQIGIYGMSYFGDCLEHMLKKNKIEVLFGIDRNAEMLYNLHIPIYDMCMEIPNADVIIVTAIASFAQIKKDLETKIDSNTDIVSLEEILYE